MSVPGIQAGRQAGTCQPAFLCETHPHTPVPSVIDEMRASAPQLLRAPRPGGRGRAVFMPCYQLFFPPLVNACI